MHALPRPAWLAATRMALRMLDEAHRQGIRRIDATVVRDFAPGHRWARLLGFRPYARLEAYGPDGQDHVGYERLG
jgi:RimJ/RimL family protein N-acetyltransferase